MFVLHSCSKNYGYMGSTSATAALLALTAPHLYGVAMRDAIYGWQMSLSKGMGQKILSMEGWWWGKGMCTPVVRVLLFMKTRVHLVCVWLLLCNEGNGWNCWLCSTGMPIQRTRFKMFCCACLQLLTAACKIPHNTHKVCLRRVKWAHLLEITFLTRKSAIVFA